MKKLFFVMIFIVCIYSFSFAADKNENSSVAPTPTTKIESFSAKTGVVIVRGYSNIGSIRGMGSEVFVDAREYCDANNQKSKEYGIGIVVKEYTRLERDNTSYIDYNEIESLLAGIDYIAKANKKITNMDNFEASFKTRGNFSITTFNSSQSNEISLVISSGYIGKTTSFLNISDLDTFRNLILKAKEQIDIAKKRQ